MKRYTDKHKSNNEDVRGEDTSNSIVIPQNSSLTAAIKSATPTEPPHSVLNMRNEEVEMVSVKGGRIVREFVSRPKTLFRFLKENGFSRAEWARMRVAPETARYCEEVELELQDDLVCNALIGNYDPSLVARLLGIGKEEIAPSPAININLQIDGNVLPKRIEVDG